MATGSDEGVVGHHIGLHIVSVHLVEKVECQLVAARLLTSSYQAAVGDHIPFTAPSHHVLEDCHSLFYLHEESTVQDIGLPLSVKNGNMFGSLSYRGRAMQVISLLTIKCCDLGSHRLEV